QRRLESFFSLLARGREGQGRPAEALQAYLDFSAFAGGRGLVNTPGEQGRRLRPDLWGCDRVGALMARATPPQRGQLEDAVSARWHRVRARDAGELRRFVAEFGPETAAGREARFELTRRLLNGHCLEAELLLSRLLQEAADPPTQARAA